MALSYSLASHVLATGNASTGTMPTDGSSSRRSCRTSTPDLLSASPRWVAGGAPEEVTCRGDTAEPVERRFLVAEDRYDIGSHGYVIDENRDRFYDGPSSFVG